MTKQTVAEALAEALVDEVRVEMVRKRRTNADLGVVIGVTPHTAGRRLKNDPPFNLIELAQIASWLGVGLATLTERAQSSVAAATAITTEQSALAGVVSS